MAINNHIEQNIMAVTMLRKLSIGRVIARTTSILHKHILHEINASEIIKIKEEINKIITSKIITPHILQRYNFTAGYSIVELKLGKKFKRKTLVESKIRQNYSLNIITLQKKMPTISKNGKASYKVEINNYPIPINIIESDDIIILIGSEKNFNKLFSDLAD